MKYFYISCLLLSSFFTYKTLSAKDNYTQYAFFMPKGAFEQNTTLDDIESMRPRQPKPTQTWQDTEQTQEEAPAPKITLPYVKKKIKLQKEIANNKVKEETPQVSATTPPNNTLEKPEQTVKPAPLAISPELLEKLNKYSLEDTPLEKAEITPPAQISKPIPQKSLAQMLSDVPYPNPSLPKFQQAYASYVMDLRIFNRRGKLPVNTTQEKTLQKANSIRRFDVK